MSNRFYFTKICAIAFSLFMVSEFDWIFSGRSLAQTISDPTDFVAEETPSESIAPADSVLKTEPKAFLGVIVEKAPDEILTIKLSSRLPNHIRVYFARNGRYYEDPDAAISFVLDEEVVASHETDEHGQWFFDRFENGEYFFFVEDAKRRRVAQARLIFVDDDELIRDGATKIKECVENHLDVVFYENSDCVCVCSYQCCSLRCCPLLAGVVPGVILPFIENKPKPKPISPSGR